MAAGSPEEIEEMKREGTPVNLRNFPDLSYTNDEPVDIIAKLPQRTVINNVMVPPLPKGFAAFRLKDIQGVIPGLALKDRQAMEEQDQIVTMSNLYLKH